MLVLSRRRHERIVIGESIVVEVISIHEGKVKLGVEAPNGVPIRRGELPPRDAKPSEGAEAA